MNKNFISLLKTIIDIKKKNKQLPFLIESDLYNILSVYYSVKSKYNVFRFEINNSIIYPIEKYSDTFSFLYKHNLNDKYDLVFSYS